MQLQVPGYTRFGAISHSHQLGSGAGSGLVVFVKNSMAARCKKLQEREHIIWVRVSGAYDLYLAFCYVNPAGSTRWRSAEEKQLFFASLRDTINAYKAKGQVLVLGDFNAHTSGLSDSCEQGEQVLQQLAAAVPPLVLPMQGVPPRKSQSTGPANFFGRLLCEEVCMATSSVILNGRTPGDMDGKCTFYGHGAPSVIDYAVCQTALLSHVKSFVVLHRLPESRHCMIVCTLDQVEEDMMPGERGPPSPRMPRWQPGKRVEYVQAIQKRHGQFDQVLRSMEGGMVCPTEALAQLSEILVEAATDAFGPATGQPGKMADGRQPNKWFKHCKAEHAALKAAIARGDTHAAKEWRKKFNAVKRRWKAHYSEVWHRRLIHDLRFNPRRFWTAYQNPKRAVVEHTLQELNAYWKQLFGSTGMGALHESFADVQTLIQSLQFDQSSHRYKQAEKMNRAFDGEEMRAAIQRLKWGRAAGPDGMPVEFIKGAYVESVGPEYTRHEYVLQPYLVRLYNGIFRTGSFPAHWADAGITAVYKKGDPSLLDNYRGIAVGNALGKLYSTLLDARLSTFAEATGLRAQGQSGFRKGRGTMDNVYILRHLLDKHRLGYGVAPGAAIYACFVDFRKAYDSVHRDLLIEYLRSKGVHGSMLQAIASMYMKPMLMARRQKEIAAPFPSTCGVKQGDPLSPLLFGMFIDQFEWWLKTKLPECGVALTSQQRIQLLLFADDLVLLSNSPEGLQSQLALLEEFCAQKAMCVNTSKTEIVVYRKTRDGTRNPLPTWTYAGVPIQVSDTFKYLGIWLHGRMGAQDAVKPLFQAGTRAMWAMVGRFKAMGLKDMYLKLHMFDTVVQPILCYGCEVWGPDLLQNCKKPQSLLSNSLQGVVTSFLRHLGKLRKSTPVPVIHREFGRPPLSRRWCQQIVRFWNRCGHEVHPGSYLRQAFWDNLCMTRIQQRGGYTCWAECVLRMLRSLGLKAYAEQVTNAVLQLNHNRYSMEARLPVLSEDVVLAAWDNVWGSWWQPRLPPRNPVCKEAKLAAYEYWMAVPSCPEGEQGLFEQERDPWYPLHMPWYVRYTHKCHPLHVWSLARMRCGSHSLGVETGRWGPQRLNRTERLCRKCAMGVMEDEMHVLLECPAMETLRCEYPSLFSMFGADADLGMLEPTDVHMRGFMNQSTPALASYVHWCCEFRETLPDFDTWMNSDVT